MKFVIKHLDLKVVIRTLYLHAQPFGLGMIPHFTDQVEDLAEEEINSLLTQPAQEMFNTNGIYESWDGKKLLTVDYISPLMAVKLSKAFNTTPQYWMNIQASHDLWEVMQKEKDAISEVEQLL